MLTDNSPVYTAAVQVEAMRKRLEEEDAILPFGTGPAGRLAVTKLKSTLTGRGVTPPQDLLDYYQAIGLKVQSGGVHLRAPGHPEDLAVNLLGIDQVLSRLPQPTTKTQATEEVRFLPLATSPTVDVWYDLPRQRVTYGTPGKNMTPTPLTLHEWVGQLATDAGKVMGSRGTPEMESHPAMEARGDSLDSMKAVFDSELTDFTVDRRWVKQLLTWVAEFENRNEDHMNFLGGNLVGVYRLHWRKDDTEAWLDLLGIDNYPDLRTAYHDLPAINPDFNVVGNPVNASYLYAAHRILISDLDDRDKERAAVAVLCIMHYQFLSSLMYHQFPYRAQEAIALALYESLSRKSMLKQYHTWGNLVKARAGDVLESRSIHRPTLDQFGPDERLVYAISDIQSRIREVVKKLKSEYMRLRDADARVMSQGTTMINNEGETVLKEYENRTEALLRQMREICGDRVDLIRQELVDQTLKLVTTADERHLRTVLEYISEHINDPKHPEVLELVQRLVRFVQDYARRAPPGEATIVHLVLKVRNLMRSSQLTAPEAVALRNLGVEVVEDALSRRSDSIKASSRIAMFVFLTLRLLTVNHYQ